MTRGTETEAWKRLVLHSLPDPAWLSPDAPHGDVVLSTRVRVLRNLRGRRFPHRAARTELREIQEVLVGAARAVLPDLEVLKHLSEAERDYLVGCRLASTDFAWSEVGRALLLDRDRRVGLMVNEEDHLRLQALTAGWSPESAARAAEEALGALESRLEFAWSPRFGFLAASPYNAGEGVRRSAMFHLIGLAQSKRLPSVLKALAVRGIVARGLFGEASRAIGAFVQVSVLRVPGSEFAGACEYLMREERDARQTVSGAVLAEKAQRAMDYAARSRTLALADALRILGWVRWGAVAGLPGFDFGPRGVDRALTALDLRAARDDRRRADFVRSSLRL